MNGLKTIILWRDRMIPLFKVHAPKNIGAKLQEVFDSGFLTEGVYSDKFEKSLCEYLGNDNVCLVNSCTSALLLACHLSNVKPGDEVITTAMTCMATNEPFYNAGAKLVFADIDPTTGNIDPEDIKRKVTDKTKAIVVVHWAGQPVDLEEINSLAKQKGIKVIEDAAHALGAEYHDKKIGNHSDFVCFSFQAIKHLTTADGGALVCKSEQDAERVRKIRWYGLDRKYAERTGRSRWEQDIVESGFKLHMNNLNAAIGLEQMKSIDFIVNSHIENGRYYDQHINNEKIVKLCRPSDGSSYWIYSILVEDREHFQQYMRDNKIASDVVHIRNDRYTVFKEFQRDDLPNLDYFSTRLTNIPVGWWLSADERRYIVDIINKY
jgi:perosamine synthetase